MVAKDLAMATGMVLQGVDVTENGVEKVVAETLIESRVKHLASREVRQRGGQYPQSHSLRLRNSCFAASHSTGRSRPAA